MPLLSRTFLAAIVLLGLGFPLPARAGDPPLLGLQLTPAPLYASETHSVVVTSHATVPLAVTLSADGGWEVEPIHLTLQPGEIATAAVTGIGSKPGTLTATGDPIAVDAFLVGRVVLTTQLYDEKPGSGVPIPLLAFLAATAFLGALWLILWRRNATR